MTFVAAWTFKPECRKAVEARFKETGGLPPEGVKMLGRWSGPNNGVCIADVKTTTCGVELEFVDRARSRARVKVCDVVSVIHIPNHEIREGILAETTY